MFLGEDYSSDHVEIANLLRTNFQSVYQDPINFSPDEHSHIPHRTEEILLIQFSEDEVLPALSDIDTKKGAGPDQIPPAFLKRLKTHYLVSYVNSLINLFKKESFPDFLKSSTSSQYLNPITKLILRTIEA